MISRQVEPVLRDAYVRHAPLVHGLLPPEPTGGADGGGLGGDGGEGGGGLGGYASPQQMHAALLLLRLGPCPPATSPDPQPAIRLLLRSALVETERDDGLAPAETQRRRRGRRHASACVIAHMLRAERARRSLLVLAAPPLGVLAAQALFSAMEAEWPNAEMADGVAAAAAPHFSFAVEQLELAVLRFLCGE